MTTIEVREMVRLIAAELGMPEPLLCFNEHKKTSVASWCRDGNRVTLHMALKDWHGLEGATLHEMAHALRFHEAMGHGAAHDVAFFQALCRVVDCWLGDRTRYEWHKDYKCIWALAYRAGYTTKQWFRDERREGAILAAVAAGRISIERAASRKLVHAGDHVEWNSKRLGPASGIVEAARVGCRARVRLPDGRLWYVPQDWLKISGGNK